MNPQQPTSPKIQIESCDGAAFMGGMSPFKIFSSRLSSSFHDMGRESLGILPPDHFARESLGFMNQSLSESFIRDPLSYKSIVHVQEYGRESLECGKESLGILQINKLDLKFGDEYACVPEITLPTIEENSTSIDVGSLNTAFLFPNSRQFPLSSGSASTNPSFNSCSLEGPSEIFKLSRNYSPKNKSASGPSALNHAKFLTSELEEFRPRYYSMPEAIENLSEKVSPRVFGSFQGNISFEEEKEDRFFDSVFIEGNHIANKIADGSIILEKSFDGESNLLDRTPQPTWTNDFDKSAETQAGTVETGTVFKTIDKMIPMNAESGSDPPQSQCTNQSRDLNAVPANLSHVTNDSQRSNNQSRDPKAMLQSLSEILNNSRHSDSQRSEGQHLISSLAEILCDKSNSSSKRNVVMDDSGHSSIIEQSDSPDQEDYQSYEVLDLRKRTVEVSKNSNSSDKVLDLSLKGKPITKTSKHCLSQSFEVPNTSVLPREQKKRAPSLTSLDGSNNKNSVSNSLVKTNKISVNAALPNLKTKAMPKPTVVSTKRGPMKAVIPVKDMKRKSVNVTPERSDNKVLSSMQTRTSTPIRDPKMKPVAASTPTAENQAPETSPLVKPNNECRSTGSPKTSILALPSQSNANPRIVSRTLQMSKLKKMGTLSLLGPRKLSLSTQTSKEKSNERRSPSLPSPSSYISKDNSTDARLVPSLPSNSYQLTKEKCNDAKLSPSLPSTSASATKCSSPSLLPRVDKTRPYRRNSVGDIRKMSAAEGNANRSKRSNSIGKESNLLSVRDKIKEALKVSVYAQGKKTVLSESNNNIRVDNVRAVTKPTTLTTRPKMGNKENSAS